MAAVKDAEPKKPTCFIAMPVSTRTQEAELYGDNDHWLHVMESLFVKAIETAGFEAIRPVAQGAHLIHGMIIKHLSQADLVLCDLSSHNPNVFFELGVRTSLNLPIALVCDEHTDLPFDTSGINTQTYNSALRGWEIEAEQGRLSAHLSKSASSCAGANPLWRQFGLSIRAQEPDTKESPLEAKLDLLADRMMLLQHRVEEGQFERERRLAMSQEEAAATSRFIDWELQQRSSLDRTPPSTLFSSAVHRLASSHAYSVAVHIHSPRQATVILQGKWPVEHVNRVTALADKYGVEAHVQMVDSIAEIRTDDNWRKKPTGDRSQGSGQRSLPAPPGAPQS